MIPPFVYGVIYKTGIDVIIYPAQDMSAYELKVPTITTIHDLMHVYKRKEFPEVGSPREYANREKYYRRVCRHSKVIVVDSDLGRDHVIETYGKLLKAKIFPLPYIPPPYKLVVESFIINNGGF